MLTSQKQSRIMCRMEFRLICGTTLGLIDDRIELIIEILCIHDLDFLQNLIALWRNRQ